VNMLGNSSPMRPKGLSHYVILTPEREWRYPDRPTLQIKLPYVFISDAPVYLSQLPPFLHMLNDPWPGTLFGGRFPINIWPRPLMWAFEWHQASKPLILKRGDPVPCHREYARGRKKFPKNGSLISELSATLRISL